MRIAVFSDVHGNPYACRAVLSAIAAQGSFDAVVAAGDLLLGGSDPAACLEMLQAGGVLAVHGNTEVYLLEPGKMPPDELHRKMWAEIQPAACWVREHIGEVGLEWVQHLPFELRFSPGGGEGEDLLVVHANRLNVEQMIYPEPAGQMRFWGEVRQPDDDPALLSVLDGSPVGVLAFGHFHHASTRRWRGQALVNVAGCSLPGVDHDPRARFTIFERHRGSWSWQQHWVEYDWRQEVSALRGSTMPYRQRFIRYFEP